jgi:hypothetical protein
MPEHPVADILGDRAAAQDPFALGKAEFYAFSDATIDEGAKIMLAGEGTDTRFALNLYGKTPITPEIAQTTPLVKFVVGTLFFTLVKGMYSQSTLHYRTLFDAAAAHAYSPEASVAAISRGDLPDEILGFGFLSVPLIQNHSETRDMDVEGRVGIAHELASHLLIGRAAVNVSNTPVRPNLASQAGKVDMRVIGGKHQFVHEDGGPLSPGHGLRPDSGPTLKCPAHEHLERFVAAGVNLLADAGYYHPGVPPEMYKAPKIEPEAGRGHLPGIGEN